MIKYYDPFFAAKMVENYQKPDLIGELALDYANSYKLAALILNATFITASAFKIPEEAKTAINIFVTLTLVAIVSARLRAIALNKVNRRLPANATRSEKNTTIVYEFTIGLAIQIPYIAFDILMSKINNDQTQHTLRLIFFILIFTIAVPNFLKDIIVFCMSPIICCCPKELPSNQEQLLTYGDDQTAAALKFKLLEAIRTELFILPGIFLQCFYENNPILFYVSFATLTAAFLQKDLPAAYIVYNEMRKNKWENIFEIEANHDIENQPGSAAAITRARVKNGLAATDVSINSSSGYLPGVEDVYAK